MDILCNYICIYVIYVYGDKNISKLVLYFIYFQCLGFLGLGGGQVKGQRQEEQYMLVLVIFYENDYLGN